MADWLKKEVKKGDESEDSEFELGEGDLKKAGSSFAAALQASDAIVEANLIEQERKEIRGELKKLNQLAAKE